MTFEIELPDYFKEIIKTAAKEQNWNIEVNKYQHFYVDAVFY